MILNYIKHTMANKSNKYNCIFAICFCFTCLFQIQLSAQTIQATFHGHWFHYPIGSAAKLDSNYTRLDTIVEISFRKDGTYNYKGIIKTDVFTPGKGHLKFKKNFRYMDGKYEIYYNELTLLSGFAADDKALHKTFEIASGINKFKQEVPYFKLWDTYYQYEYVAVEYFSPLESFISSKRQLQILCVENKAENKIDSLPFWTSSKHCAFENEWPKPVLMYREAPLNTSMIDSLAYLPEDIDKLYKFDSNKRLTHYYYTPKMDKSFYYTFSYVGDASEKNITIQSIKDSKDQMDYVFVRDDKNCLQKIEQYNADHQLVMVYSLAK